MPVIHDPILKFQKKKMTGMKLGKKKAALKITLRLSVVYYLVMSEIIIQVQIQADSFVSDTNGVINS